MHTLQKLEADAGSREVFLRREGSIVEDNAGYVPFDFGQRWPRDRTWDRTTVSLGWFAFKPLHHL
jgi:hypothetical protein